MNPIVFLFLNDQVAFYLKPPVSTECGYWGEKQQILWYSLWEEKINYQMTNTDKETSVKQKAVNTRKCIRLNTIQSNTGEKRRHSIDLPPRKHKQACSNVPWANTLECKHAASPAKDIPLYQKIVSKSFAIKSRSANLHNSKLKCYLCNYWITKKESAAS